LGPVLVGALQVAGFGAGLNFFVLALPCFLCGVLVLLPFFRAGGQVRSASAPA
jgi:hypothetical protein